MKKVFLFAILLIFVIPLVEAQNFKLDEIKDLKVQCINNGTFCSAAAKCNVTILYANNSILVDNKLMTNQNSFHNYTIVTSILDSYSCSATCCDGVYCSTKDCNFKVTTTGKEDGNTLPLFLLLGGFIIFGFASYLKNEYIGLLSGFMFIVAGIYMMVYGLATFSDMYTRAISFITLGIGLMVCFIAIVEMFYSDLGIMGGGESDD